jgi:hypothetical protein
MLLRARPLAFAQKVVNVAARHASEYAVAPYRNLVHATETQRTEWAAADVLLHARMRDHVPAALAHNGEETFDDHLVGVQSVLRSWNAEEHLTNAALFHSIYGTEGFQGFKLPLSHRAEIAELIGPEAERLAWIFCMVDRATVDATVLPPTARPPSEYVAKPPSFYARAELGAFEIPLKSSDEWLDFLTLTLADWLEQVEGASSRKTMLSFVGADGHVSRDKVLFEKGEAWAYRREAYAAMAELLGAHGLDVAPRMHADVYGREPEATRGLVMPTTPCMSQAAVDASEAIESAKFRAA